jgi:hypothetical protein
MQLDSAKPGVPGDQTLARLNLLKLDDVLLRAGGVLCALWLVCSAAGLAHASSTEGTLTGAIGLVVLAATAPLGVLVAGFNLRRREHRAWALHKLVDDHVEISASGLVRDSDFTQATLDRAIRDLNNAGAALLVWDRKADLIQDGRLRTARVEVEDCGSCGAKVAVSVRVADVDAARCPYCHDSLGAERVMEERARLIDELDGDAAATRSGPFGSGFSLWIFAVLTFVFWPAGVAYAVWHWRANR